MMKIFFVLLVLVTEFRVRAGIGWKPAAGNVDNNDRGAESQALQQQQQQQQPPTQQPSFDFYNVANYTFQEGSTALLPCVIRNLANESVSWIRFSDSHILTVDEEVFVSDPRISTIRESNDAWTLQIKSVSPQDDGKYECQVSTEPKLSHFVHLIVRVPLVYILDGGGGGDVFVKSASSVDLKCVVAQSLRPPTYVEWLHHGQRLAASTSTNNNRLRENGGGPQISVTPIEVISPGTSMATLSIVKASKANSGEYTCWPAQMPNASVTLHVVDNNPAELQTSHAQTAGSFRAFHKFFLQLVILRGSLLR